MSGTPRRRPRPRARARDEPAIATAELEESLIKQLVGRPLLAPRAVLDAGVNPESFADPIARLIFATVVRIVERGETPDGEAVRAELTRRGEWAEIEVDEGSWDNVLLGAPNTAAPEADAAAIAATRAAELLGARRDERIAELIGRLGPAMNGRRDPVEAGHLLDELRRANVIDEARAGPLEVMTARQLAALPDPPVDDEILGCLVVRGQRLIVGGQTGEGKTTLALVRAIVTGESFLDWQGRSEGGRVLVVDAEQGLRTLKRRLREAGLDECDRLDIARVPDGLSLDSNPDDVAQFEARLAAGSYEVVVADPLYKLHTGDSNEERQAVDLMRRFDAWREQHGFALVLPVHCRKPIPGAKFSIHDLFGSSAYVRGAEIVVGIQRIGPGLSLLHFLKDRDGDLPVGTKWRLLFDRDAGFRRDPDDGNERDVGAEIEELLEDGTWRTAREIAAPRDRGGIGRARDDVEHTLELDARFVSRPGAAVGRSAKATCWLLARLARPLEPVGGSGTERGDWLDIFSPEGGEVEASPVGDWPGGVRPVEQTP